MGNLIIYLDESGNLGFDFCRSKTTRYLVIGVLVFLEDTAHTAMVRAVRKTVKNKIPKTIVELKGRSLALPIKKYFLKEMNKEEKWRLYVAIADKKSWIEHHIRNHQREPEKKALYDELAKRLLSQLDYLETAHSIEIIVDRSKNKDEIAIFDQAIMTEMKKRVGKKAQLAIRHRDSQGEAGLQAIDIFCSGVSRKYESADESWYREFSDRIAAEVEYKF